MGWLESAALLFDPWLDVRRARTRLAALDQRVAADVATLEPQLRHRACAALAPALRDARARAFAEHALGWAGAHLDGGDAACSGDAREWVAFRFQQVHPERENPWGHSARAVVVLPDKPALASAPPDVCHHLERAIAAGTPDPRAQAWIEWLLRRVEMQGTLAGVSLDGRHFFRVDDALLVMVAAWRHTGDFRFLNCLLRHGDSLLRDRRARRDHVAAAALVCVCAVREAALEELGA